MDIVIDYGLIMLGILISFGAQVFIKIAYNKYLNKLNSKNISGYNAARYILDSNGLNNIDVVETSGFLTDHYDPSKKIIKLSSSIYNGCSISSVSVAAHECGHAIQDKDGYIFMKFRSFLVPFVNFASYAGYFAVLIGILASSYDLIWFGIVMELVILLFQIVTLPVEVNASVRALKQLKNLSILSDREVSGSKTVLSAAACTYIASILTSLLQILRLLLMVNRRND